MSVVGYPTPNKGKARALLNAFCGGAGGDVVTEIPKRLLPGAAAFYGVTEATVHLWKQAKAEGRDWYYIDNADITSKTTLSLFRELTRLQKVEAAERQPLLTLPVGR